MSTHKSSRYLDGLLMRVGHDSNSCPRQCVPPAVCPRQCSNLCTCPGISRAESHRQTGLLSGALLGAAAWNIESAWDNPAAKPRVGSD